MTSPTRHQRGANPYPSAPAPSNQLSRWGFFLDLALIKTTGAALVLPQTWAALAHGSDINEFAVGLGAIMLGGSEFRSLVLELVKAWRRS